MDCCRNLFHAAANQEMPDVGVRVETVLAYFERER